MITRLCYNPIDFMPTPVEQEPYLQVKTIDRFITAILDEAQTGLPGLYTWTLLSGSTQYWVPEYIYCLYQHRSDGLAVEILPSLGNQDRDAVMTMYNTMLAEIDLSNETIYHEPHTATEEEDVLHRIALEKAPSIMLICARVKAEDQETPRNSLLLFHAKVYNTKEALEMIKDEFLSDGYDEVAQPELV